MKFSPVRDIASSVLGVAFGGVGLVGTAAKKFLVAQDDSFAKRFTIGAIATVVTGGAALLPFLVAKAGRETKAEVAAARQNVVDGRY